MRKILLIFLFAILLFSCAQSPQSSEVPTLITPIAARTDFPSSLAQPDELIVVGRLKYISTPPDCGYLHIGAVAEYTDLKIIDGIYLKDAIYVVHGCAELKRKEYAEGSGDLESFHVGDYHLLRLTLRNVDKIGMIDLGDIQLPVDNNEDACVKGCDAETLVGRLEGMYFSSQVDLYAQ